MLNGPLAFIYTVIMDQVASEFNLTKGLHDSRQQIRRNEDPFAVAMSLKNNYVRRTRITLKGTFSCCMAYNGSYSRFS